MEFEGSRLFLNIPIEVARIPDIKDKSILLFGEIYSMLNVTGKFYMSNKALADRLRCSTKTISNCITQLRELGLIDVKMIRNNGTKAIEKREISLNPLWKENSIGVWKKSSRGYRNEFLGGIEKNFQENRTINKTINRTVNNNILSVSQTKHDDAPLAGQTITLADDCKTIIDYLNDKTGSSYRANTPKTKQLIQARLKEGFTVDDFKRVIDNKTATWGNDERMRKYLRPLTLFGTKFESYLNEQSNKRSRDNSDLPEYLRGW